MTDRSPSHGVPDVSSFNDELRIRWQCMRPILYSVTGTMAAGPELVIGLIGALGTDLKHIGARLALELQRVDYTTHIVRLTDILVHCHKYEHLSALAGGPEDQRISKLMDAGDDLRRTAKRGDAVTLLALGAIRELREKHSGKRNQPMPRTAYILHSLKHTAEISMLRQIYGEAFICISIYTPRNARVSVLQDRISRTNNDYNPETYLSIASDLANRDEKDTGDDYGQNVRDIFAEGDAFIDASDRNGVTGQISRLIEILFWHPNRTPTIDEYGLFHAKAAALRSADLSRQVGAVIMTVNGEIISTGCNEVPRAGGGAVWEGNLEDAAFDHRDFQKGFDPSAAMKSALLGEIFERLTSAGWLSEERSRQTPIELANEALHGSKPALLSGTRAASIVEFGRIVHAEMSAITDAARRGISVKNASLYCTTFPCHVCARHIIAAGIKQVIYIEPYPKSLAKDLYKGPLNVDDDQSADPGAVRFRPFMGVSPRRYINFFEMPKRKNERGHTLEWRPLEARPRIRELSGATTDVETAQAELLVENKVAWGLVAGT